jgi:hypothetical protein
VPKPTSKPAAITMAQLASIRGVCISSAGKMNLAAKGAANMPSKNVMRQGDSAD